MRIPEDSPAGRYLAAMRRSRDTSLPIAARRDALAEANRYAMSFGFERTRDLDAYLLLENES